MNFKITTDSTSDLPQAFYDTNNVSVVRMMGNFKGRQISDGFQDITVSEFYNALREGETSTTSQITPPVMEEFLRENLKDADKILHFSLSSGLSGTVASSLLARDSVLEDPEFKGKKVEIIDTKNATGGQGLLVYIACRLRDEGRSFEEVKEEIEKLVPRVNSIFTVEDLQTLKRGGRISSMAASVGTILSIKPVLSINSEGKLIALTKAKGRRKAMSVMVDYINQLYDPGSYTKTFLCHGDDLEDAETLREMILSKTSIEDIEIFPVGMVIGSHTGPGVLAFHFVGKEDIKLQ